MDLYKKRIELISFQKDTAEWALILEREWKSSLTQIVEAVERLDESVGAVQTSRMSAGMDGPLDITSW
ncbi:hypothetical protein LINGRAHAP2_LOCUS7897, partial [Linum grandiflorum]